ncbi:MAG TPA: TonB-dependent siderophore receptor [Gemmatimonadaceae bacterium]
MKKKRKKKSKQSAAPEQPARSTNKGRPHASTRSSWTLTSMLVASAAFGATASPVFAQVPAQSPSATRLATRSFEIPAGTLRDALSAFTRATALTINDPKGVVGDQQSSGISGVFTADEALRRLLAGTGVTYRFTSSRSLQLDLGPLPEPVSTARATQLSAVTVEGARKQTLSSPKRTEPLEDTPQAITVVPADVIAQQGATSLRDVLRNVPSITINAGEGGATPGDNFNVRGFSARSDMFVDGVRDMGGYSRDAFNFEQVEVAEGPASAYTGRGSTGGSINMVSKTPSLGEARSVTATGGSADQRRVTADLNQPLEPLGLRGTALRLNAMWQDGGVAGLDVVEKESWGVAPSLALGLGSPTQLTLSYVHTGQDAVPSYGVQSFERVPSIDTENFFGLRTIDFERVHADQGMVRLDHQFGESLRLRNQLSRGHSAGDRIVTYAKLEDGTRSPKSHITEDDILTNQTNLAASFATGAVQHDLSVGLELTHEKSSFGHYTFSDPPPAVTDFDNPDPALSYHPVVSETPAPRRVTANSVGIYTFDTFKAGEHWTVNGGLRWDTYRPRYADSVSKPVASASAVSAQAGVVYKPTRDGSVYAAYSTSFNPSIQNLAYESVKSGELEPERNRSIEIGSKWMLFKQRLLATLAVFRTNKTNARTPDASDPSVNILGGKQRVQGVELGASGNLTRAWSLFAGYTYLDSKYLASGTTEQVGTELANVPEHAANIWTTYRLPWHLEVGGGVRFVDRRLLRGTTYVPSYHTIDAEAAYSVNDHLGLRLNIYNLTDELYYDSGRFWVPGPSRSLALATTVTF